MFLAQVGNQEKAMKGLRVVYKLNHLRSREEYPVSVPAGETCPSNMHGYGWFTGEIRHCGGCKEWPVSARQERQAETVGVQMQRGQ